MLKKLSAYLRRAIGPVRPDRPGPGPVRALYDARASEAWKRETRHFLGPTGPGSGPHQLHPDLKMEILIDVLDSLIRPSGP